MLQHQQLLIIAAPTNLHGKIRKSLDTRGVPDYFRRLSIRRTGDLSLFLAYIDGRIKALICVAAMSLSSLARLFIAHRVKLCIIPMLRAGSLMQPIREEAEAGILEYKVWLKSGNKGDYVAPVYDCTLANLPKPIGTSTS